jgi:hypothetical protein
MKDMPELLICVFPVDMPSYNTYATEVIKPKKNRLVFLMCVDSHYAVWEVFLKERDENQQWIGQAPWKVVPPVRIYPEEDRSSTKGHLC